MRYWLREVAGWVLVGLGLLAFYTCYDLLRRGRITEASAFTVVGIFIFRGGIHLLKIAVAAQVCMEAQRRAEREEKQAKPDAANGRTPAPMRTG
jgi:hypothetical protein